MIESEVARNSCQHEKPTQSTQDYFPFGSLLPGRGVDQAEYKYGFNSKENDNEVYGDANFQDYGMRMYDTRVGRFVSADPITKSYPMLTPYQFASNSVISAIDLDGLEAWLKIRNWEFADKALYQIYSDSKIKKMIDDGTRLTCSALPVTIYTSYAAANGLEVEFSFKNGTTLNSSTFQPDPLSKKSSLEQFQDVVRASFKTYTLSDAMKNIPRSIAAPGDIILELEPGAPSGHTYVIRGVDQSLGDRAPKSGEHPVAWGNLSNGQAQLLNWGLIGFSDNVFLKSFFRFKELASVDKITPMPTFGHKSLSPSPWMVPEPSIVEIDTATK